MTEIFIVAAETFIPEVAVDSFVAGAARQDSFAPAPPTESFCEDCP